MSQQTFIGFALNAIDAKGRLSVHAPFREAVAARSGDRTLYLGLHERDRCLVAYDGLKLSRLEAEIERRFGDDFGPERDGFTRRVYGAREPQTPDDTGRILVSPTMKALGELDRHAFFLGTGDSFEIWNPDVLLETRAAGDRALERIVRGHVEARK